MTKDELVTKLAESTGITKKKAGEILSLLADNISEAQGPPDPPRIGFDV